MGVATEEEIIREIMDVWVNEGDENLSEGDMRGSPKHPEFVYRIAGEWMGWSDYLGVDAFTKEYEENKYQDYLEDKAFEKLHSKYH